MDIEVKYIMDTIKSILHKKPMHTECTPAYLNELDYWKIYQIAMKNNIANLVAFKICQDASIPKEIRAKFDNERLKNIMQQTKQSSVLIDLKNICEKTEKKGILLKGSIIKDYYPDPFMRSMSDIDVFMEKEDIEQLYGTFIELGYSPGVQDKDNHYEFQKNVIAKVEFHPELVALDSEYGEKVFLRKHPSAKSIADEMNIWNHTMDYDGCKYYRQLTPEYHYVYIVMHALSHLLISGTGIRTFVDIWVMNHQYARKWDRKLLNGILENFGLLRFEHYALALSDRWFELDVDGCISIEIEEDVLDAMEWFILNSGTYGNVSNGLLKEMKHDASAISKTKYLIHSFFLPLSDMRRYYQVLDSKPYLLPIVWIYRGFEVLIKRRSNIKNKITLVANVDQDKADKIKELFDRMIQ